MDEEWPKSVSAEIFAAYNKVQNELIERALERVRLREHDMQKEGWC